MSTRASSKTVVKPAMPVRHKIYMVLGLMFFFGSLFWFANLSTQKQIAGKFQSITLSGFDPKNSIQLVNGNGTNVLYILADPDCPHCRQFNSELPKIENTTVHVFPFPLTSIHPKAAEIARNVWCSPDKLAAWNAYMANQTLPAEAPLMCDSSAIDKNLKAGFSKGVSGTPTFINGKTGKVGTGFQSAKEVMLFLSDTN